MDTTATKQRVGDVVRASAGSAGDDIDQALYSIEQTPNWSSNGRLQQTHDILTGARASIGFALEAIGPAPGSYRVTTDQLDEYEAKLQTLTDDELRDELADATSAVDHEPHASIAIGAVTMEQARREAQRSSR